MAVCEDAPCCGCCGPAVWAAEAQAEEEAAWDRMNDPDAWDFEEDDDEDDEDSSEYSGPEDFGWAGDSALCGE